MDIGTAKITPEEMQGVPHHLIDILEPDTAFNVAMFQKLAKEAMRHLCPGTDSCCRRRHRILYSGAAL